jgi:hypothetical protein
MRNRDLRAISVVHTGGLDELIGMKTEEAELGGAVPQLPPAACLPDPTADRV